MATPPTKLDESEVSERLRKLRGWTKEDGTIARSLHFKDFKQAKSFVDRVADAAEESGHHPDIHIEKASEVRLVLTTHSAGGLTKNDFEMAEKIDRVTGGSPG
ncbi:MAG: 4a-hydroxytetrahydrobiopterin dehydratase [Chloroflexi bacterium]|nr:MAG: 4a-hydroxytetrahydrobiopterin dehydratase [Chloroflexota bacterium]TMG38058.1 MAG: 4a-hydroxytetrahydrobiopterin dehydratase [Chloroflexota bacterium]TMG39559.1 MAG: 4a-hydroxytetrahydrobiopterin dehydratase [Chloroflexota bacterium]